MFSAGFYLPSILVLSTAVGFAQFDWSFKIKTATSITRIDALDALRAATMIFGVFLHGAVPYMQIQMPSLVWPVKSASPEIGFDLVFWYLHGFRIPLFFLVAGFFAALLCGLRGTGSYLAHRVSRIGIPLMAAMLLILPAVYYIWGYGLAEQDVTTWREVRHMSFHGNPVKDQLLGLAHLWFLQYLFIYSAVYALFRQLKPRWFQREGKRSLLENWWTPLLLVAITFPLLWARPEIYTDYDNRWFPEPWQLVYYSVFFIAGLSLYRVRNLMDRLRVTGPIYLLASLPVFAIVLRLLQENLAVNGASPGSDWMFGLATALYSWLAIWGFLGVCLMMFKHSSYRIRYVSDAAYWIYLVHLPLLGLIQLSLVAGEGSIGLRLPSAAGYAISVCATLAIALLTYRYFVRYGVIGKWLHGPKERPGSVLISMTRHREVETVKCQPKA